MSKRTGGLCRALVLWVALALAPSSVGRAQGDASASTSTSTNADATSSTPVTGTSAQSQSEPPPNPTTRVEQPPTGPVGRDAARASQWRFLRPSYFALCPLAGCFELDDYPVPWDPSVEGQPFIFISEINVPIVFNTLGDAMVDHDSFAIGGTILPAFQARMLQTDSWPVSTPSFSPTLMLDLYLLTHPSYAYDEADWEKRVTHTAHLGIGLRHHSNGQEVCPFLEDLAEPRYHSDRDDGCNPNAVRWTRDNINFRTGEFTSTALLLQLDYELNTLDARTGAEAYGLVLSAIGGLELPKDWVGALEREHRTLYGTSSLRLRLGVWTNFKPKTVLPYARLTGELSAAVFSGEALDDIDPAQHHLSAEVRWTFDHLAGTGLYARWEEGRDAYNIRYLSGMHRIHWGLVFEPRSEVYRKPRNGHHARSARGVGAD